MLYALVFFTGDPAHPAARPRPAGRDDGHPDRQDPERQGARPRTWSGPPDHRAAGQRPGCRRGRGRHRGQPQHRHLRPRRQRRPGPSARRDRAAAVPPGRHTAPGGGHPGAHRAAPPPSGSATPPDSAAPRGPRPAAAAPRRPPTEPPAAASATPAPRPRPSRRRTPNAPAGHPGAGAADTYATLTCDRRRPGRRSTGPTDYVAACAKRQAKYLLGARRSSRAPTITNATAGTSPTTGAWVVNLDFNSERLDDLGHLHRGQRRQAGRHHPRRPGRLGADHPGAITGGTTEITGNFNQTTATDTGQPAQVRRAAADLHAGDGAVDLHRAGHRAAARPA